MSFKAMMATDMASLFLNESEFAESVTYAVNDTGASKTILAIITVVSDLASTPQGKGITGTATISAADVSRPAVYDTLTTASGQVWRVEIITGGDGVAWDLYCTSDNRAVPA
jgi:hypothetical protein